MKTDAIYKVLRLYRDRCADTERRETYVSAVSELAALEQHIAELESALRVGLGWATGGMDGEWRCCDHIQVMRDALSSGPT